MRKVSARPNQVCSGRFWSPSSCGSVVAEHQSVSSGLTVDLFPGGHILVHTAEFEEEADDAQHCQKVPVKVDFVARFFFSVSHFPEPILSALQYIAL